MVHALKKVINELESSSFGVLDSIEEEVFWTCSKEFCFQQQPWSYAIHLLFHRTRNSASLPTSATSLFSDPISCTRCASLGLPPKKNHVIFLFSIHQFGSFLGLHPFNTILDVCKSNWVEIDYNPFKVSTGDAKRDGWERIKFDKL